MNAENMPEAVLFLYSLVDHSTGEHGEIKDCLWLSESERDRWQADLVDQNLVWERDAVATPRWDVGYLLMAICSFHAAVGIQGFGEAIGCNLSKDSLTLQGLYQQYGEAVAKLAYVKAATLQEVALAYHGMVQVKTEELITNEATQPRRRRQQPATAPSLTD
jgi:hypothetical protein